MKSFLILCLSALLLLGHVNTLANDEPVLYRYTNEDGVKEINSSIPAKYAQDGYEIINFSGRVLKVVPPAPSKDDVSRANLEREILAEYSVLKRRFSSAEEIERAKRRKLENINTNIAILKGNISNLKNSIDSLVETAAEFERTGRAVPKTVLKQLEDTNAELRISEDLLKYRKQEYDEVTDKYDRDIQAFIRGESLQKQLELEALENSSGN